MRCSMMVCVPLFPDAIWLQGELGFARQKTLLQRASYYSECLSEQTLQILEVKHLFHVRTHICWLSTHSLGICKFSLNQNKCIIFNCIWNTLERNVRIRCRPNSFVCVHAALQEGKGILMHCTKFGTKDLIAQTTSLSSHLHPPSCKFYFKTEKRHIKTTALTNTCTPSHTDAHRHTKDKHALSHTEHILYTTVHAHTHI